MMESADVADSKSAVGNNVWVQVPLSAPNLLVKHTFYEVCFRFYAPFSKHTFDTLSVLSIHIKPLIYQGSREINSRTQNPYCFFLQLTKYI